MILCEKIPPVASQQQRKVLCVRQHRYHGNILSYVHNMTRSLRIKSFFTMLLDCLTIKCDLDIECLHMCVQLLHLCRKIGTVPYEHFHPR